MAEQLSRMGYSNFHTVCKFSKN